MIIDFHTHIFPEKIAKTTIEKLASKADMNAYTNGTLDGLKQSMIESHVDYSVVLPVVTKPEQFQSINTYAASINRRDGIISFGGIHPDCSDIEEKLDLICSLGLKGIKLHPDYQSVYIDDERNICIIKEACKRGLVVVIHGGIDIGMPDIVHCPPKRILHMLKEMDEFVDKKIIIAHTGGWSQWNDVEEMLVGEDVYFDVSFSVGMIPEEQLLRIIRNHGSKKIVFGTDSPWSGQNETITYIQNLDLSMQEKDNIFYQTAQKLLK